MLLINACGRCERSILQNSMRGRTMSSANFVCPVHFARASTLRKGLPTTLSGFPLLFPFLVIQYQFMRFIGPSQAVDALARQFRLFTAHAQIGRASCRERV